MTARHGLCAGLGIALSALACSGGGPDGRGFESLSHDDTKPSIVLISIDTLRADRLNVYGYAKHRTSPAIDALAQDGILHTAHIAASPWTTPSHMSLLTSLHPSTHGVISSFDELSRGLQSDAPFVRLAAGRTTLAEALLDDGYRTAAFTGGITLHPSIGFDQGFEHYLSTMYKLHERGMQEMLDWVADADPRPFFLFWHTFEVHAPYLHPDFLPDSLSDLATDVLTLGAQRVDGTERHLAAREILLRLLARHRALLPWVCSTLYDGGVSSADAWVGRLVASLRERNLYDSTLIVLTSDHGEEFADHNPEYFYDKHGHSAYEEMIRVPLIVKLPDSRHAGLVVDQVTRAIDVMPTVLQVVGAGASTSELQGEDMTPLWREQPTRERRVAFTEGTESGTELKSLRTGSHKLILEIGAESVREHGRAFVPDAIGPMHLFDLAADPGERLDLLASSPDAETASMAAELAEQIREIVSSGSAEVETIELDDRTLDELRALGYVR